MLSTPLRFGIAAATLALAVAPLAHCTSDTLTTTPSTTTIGPGGGALASSDYAIEILVPPGALTENVIFTIAAVSTSPDPGLDPEPELAPMYTITGVPLETDPNVPQSTTPVDIHFVLPVVISYTEQAYGPSSTATAYHDPTDYRVAQYVSSAWTPLANQSLDSLAYTIQGTTTTITATPNPFSVIVPPATGGTCVTLSQPCDGDDAGCVCASSYPGKCAAYAGAVNEACDAGASSNAVACCFTQGSPTCFAQSEPNGCGSPCSQLPGSSATECVPAVGPPIENASSAVSQSTCCFPNGAPVCVLSHVSMTCAGVSGGSGGDGGTLGSMESPCASVTGSTMTGCVDTTGGAQVTCCLPVGVLPTTVPQQTGDGGATVVTGDAGGSDAGATDAGTTNGTDAGGTTDASGITDAGSAADAGIDAGAAPTDASDDAAG